MFLQSQLLSIREPEAQVDARLILVLAARRLAIASDDLHFVDLYQVLNITELDVLQHERPDIITESVGLQMAGLCEEYSD